MHNGIIKSSFKTRYIQLVLALLALVFMAMPAMAQTSVPPDGTDPNNPNLGLDVGQGASGTDPTAQDIYDAPGQTTLVRQQAEQDIPAVAQNVEQKLWPDFGAYNDTYEGLAAFWGDDIISNFFANIGQLLGKWLSEFINGWIADAVQFLTGFLRIFVLNPNIAVNGLSSGGGGTGGAVDDISPYVRQGADVMFSIAIDILLLLFVLCIWKFWAEAAWRGGGNLMGAVGRLIATAGLLLAWPTIYAFEVQITNEMIKAIYFNSADQVAMLDAAMAAAVKGGLVAGAGLLANATAPVAGQVLGGVLAGGVGGVVLGTVGGIIAFVGLMIYLVLGGILVAELIYILVLKAIQTALLCAQYMFAPFFLVFFALPDTENVATGFVRSFVEVSLWTFVWVGMLKIMVIVILSDFNPWGKIIMAVGVLQLMIQVPSFLARAQISPMSDFISAGLITGGLLAGGKALANTLGSRAQHFANAVGNFGYAGAKGSPKSQTVEMNGLANEVANPGLLKDIRQAGATGQVPPKNDPNKKKPGDGTGGPGTPGAGQPLKPAGGETKKPGEDGIKTGADGKPLNADAAKKGEGAEGLNAVPPVKNPNDPAVKGAGDGTAANKAGDALATAGKTMAAAGVLGAAAAAAGAPGTLSTGEKDGDKKGDQLSQQQLAENAKALNNAANAPGADKNKDGSPKLDADGKPLKTVVPAQGADKTKAEGAVKDPASVTATAGKDGATANANAAGNATDGKGKDLNAANAADLAKGLGVAAAAGMATAAAKLPGDEVEVQGEGAGLNTDGKAIANATIPGLKGGLAPAGGANKDGSKLTGADGASKTTVAGGKDAAGANLDVTKGDATVVSKPGAVNPAAGNNAQGLNPALSATGEKLATAAASVAGGKTLDPSTVVSTEDEPLNPADPGAPLVTPAKEGTFSNGKPVAGSGSGTNTNGKVETSATGRIVSPTGLAGPDAKLDPAANPAVTGAVTGAGNGNVSGAGAGSQSIVPGQNVDATLRPAGLNQQGQAVNAAPLNADLVEEGSEAAAAGLGAAASVAGVVKTQGQGQQNLTPPSAVQPGALSATADGRPVTPPVNGTNNLSANGVNPGLAGANAGNGQTPGLVTNTNVDASLRPGANVQTNALNNGATPGVNADLVEEGTDLAGAAALGAAATVSGVVKNQGQGANSNLANQANVPAGGVDATRTNASLTPPVQRDQQLGVNTNLNGAGLSPTGSVSSATGSTGQNVDANLRPGAVPTAAVNPTASPAVTADLTEEGTDLAGAAALGAAATVSGVVKNQAGNQTAALSADGKASPITAAGQGPGGRVVPPVAGVNSSVANVTGLQGAGGNPAATVNPGQQTANLDGVRNSTGQVNAANAVPGSVNADLVEELSGDLAAAGAAATVTGVVKNQAGNQNAALSADGKASPINAAGQGPGGRVVPPATGVNSSAVNVTGLPPGTVNPAATVNPGQTTANLDGAVRSSTGQVNAQNAVPGSVNADLVEELSGDMAATGAASVTGVVRNQVSGQAANASSIGNQAANVTASGRVIPTPPVSPASNLNNVQAQVTPGTGVNAAAAVPSQFAATAGSTGSAPAAATARIAGDGGGDGGGGDGGGGDDGPIYSGPGGPPSSPSSAPTSPKNASMFDNYMQAGYRHVPYRMAAAAIRLAQGATLGVSRSGRPENVYDSQGHLMHVRFGEGASDEQKGMQIISGAYGELMSSDAEAYDAARQSAIDAGEHKPQNMAERAAAGIMAYNGGSWTQTAAAKQRFARSMAKHAALGSQAYVNGEPGNAYTEHLVNRYGPMSEEQQAWASYIMTNSDSPESGWSFRMGPATEALIQNGVPISAVSRAVAANPSVLKAQPWLRGAAIRGGCEYMSARADAEIPQGTNSLVRDAWFGNRAQTVAPEVVNAIGALTLAGAVDDNGNSACRDFATVDKVAAMVGANGRPEDYVGAYNSLRGGDHVMTRMQASFAGGGGGGGGGRSVSLPSQTVSMGSASGGYVPGGPAGVSMGGVTMAGGGGSAPGSTNMADVDVFLDGGGVNNSGIPNINPNQIPLSNLPNQQVSNNTIVNARVQQGPPPSAGGNINLGSIKAPGANVGSSSSQVSIGRVDLPSGGGNQSYTENAVVDVETSVSGQIVDNGSSDPRAAVQSAVSQYGSPQNLVKQVVAELRSHGAEWNQIYDPSKADSDPGKYQMLETAIQAYAQNPASVGAVVVASKAVGASNVSMQDVEVVQEMFDADPNWNDKNVDYGAVYTARAITQAHSQNPAEYGKPYLTRDYVDSVRRDPRFTPRPIPVKDRSGAVARYDQSPVPKDRLVKRIFERMMGQDGFNNGNG